MGKAVTLRKGRNRVRKEKDDDDFLRRIFLDTETYPEEKGNFEKGKISGA